jgi:predicted esterase
MRAAMHLPIAIFPLLLGACGGAADDSGTAGAETAGSGGSGQAGAANGSGGSSQAGSSQGVGGSSQGGSSVGSGGVAMGGSGGAAIDGGPGTGGGAGMNGLDAAVHDGGPAFDSSMCASGDGGSTSARQTPKQLGTTTAPNGYLEYLPPCYDKSVGMPLLVFWHGIGEDGNGASDLNKVSSWGPPKLIANNKWDTTRPFIVLSPQYTAANGNIAPGGGCPSSATINTFLTWALSNYNIDKKRVYLTGLSCGAIGSWDYLANFQGTVVAAAALLSGNPGDPTQAGSAWKRAGCSLGSAALWSFHGDADGTVPYAPDQATMQDVMACPQPPRRDARFTDITGGGHIIWDPIYDLTGGNGDIYQWMLANAKP